MDEPNFLGVKPIVAGGILLVAINYGFSVIRALETNDDSLVKRGLAFIYMVFYAATVFNILSSFIPLILGFLRYQRYTKACYIVGTTASVLLMLHGYGLLVFLVRILH